VGRLARFSLCAAAVLVLLVAGLAVFNYIPDDAFITLRYARNALDGRGFVFNPGERVEGYTNFLWLIVLVAGGKLGASLLPLARSLSLAFSLGTLALAALAGRRAGGAAAAPGGYVAGVTADGRAAGGPAAAGGGWGDAMRISLAPMVLAASPPFLVWSLSGTEMPLFTFILLAAVLTLRSGRRRGLPLALFALLALVRPEGLLCFAVALGWLLARGPRRGAVLAGAAGIAAVFYAPYLVWKWRYFHAIVPNTFYAKTGPAALMLANGARYVGGFLLGYGYLMAAGIALLGPERARRERYLPPLLLAAACGIDVLVLGGDWMPDYRLLLPTLPLIALVAADGALAALSRARRSPAFGIALVLLAMLPGAFRYDRFTSERGAVKIFERVGERLEAILPPRTTIACGSTGAIGYCTGMPIVDILGLTEPRIARGGSVVASQPGHLKSDGAYVFSRKPDLMLLGNVWVHRGERDRAAMPIKVQERPIVEQPGFDDEYEFVNIPLGRGFYLSCFKLRSYFLPLAAPAPAPSPEAPRR
jgi:arabinofuranosyltransferase